jgi:alpha-D-ribose 1-methylphosphonate 5-triphosphate synthase subunit PhnH
MTIGKGLADPVGDTQRAFRRILWAMSHPGEIVALGVCGEPPEGLPAAASGVLLTLADVDTPIWASEQNRRTWQRWLAFHTGAPLTGLLAEAAFAVIASAGEDVLPGDFNVGDDRYPDRSTTVIALCDALDGGTAMQLSGPGIDGTRSIAPRGPDHRFWRAVIDNNTLYPRGVDLLLVAGSHMMALPRSLTFSPPEQQPCM